MIRIMKMLSGFRNRFPNVRRITFIITAILMVYFTVKLWKT